MSTWREARNTLQRARLMRALPAIFPAPVLLHALARPLVPPLPRLAVESYWRQHPIRADRLARALAQRSGAPQGWHWRLAAPGDDDSGLPRSFRAPPAPFREKAFAPGPGACCICGQPVYRFGWHQDLWRDAKPNTRARWHACCVAAWKFWIAPQSQAAHLKRLQRRRCAQSGTRLLKTAEVDHRLPLYRVWRDHRVLPWPELLAFWGLPNLRAINRAVHREKTAREAQDRVKPVILSRCRPDAGLRRRGRGSKPDGPAGRTAVALAAEESPGSTETRCRITSGGGDPRESATESRPPGGGFPQAKPGQGERVR